MCSAVAIDSSATRKDTKARYTQMNFCTGDNTKKREDKSTSQHASKHCDNNFSPTCWNTAPCFASDQPDSAAAPRTPRWTECSSSSSSQSSRPKLPASPPSLHPLQKKENVWRYLLLYNISYLLPFFMNKL